MSSERQAEPLPALPTPHRRRRRGVLFPAFAPSQPLTRVIADENWPQADPQAPNCYLMKLYRTMNFQEKRRLSGRVVKHSSPPERGASEPPAGSAATAWRGQRERGPARNPANAQNLPSPPTPHPWLLAGLARPGSGGGAAAPKAGRVGGGMGTGCPVLGAGIRPGRVRGQAEQGADALDPGGSALGRPAPSVSWASAHPVLASGRDLGQERGVRLKCWRAGFAELRNGIHDQGSFLTLGLIFLRPESWMCPELPKGGGAEGLGREPEGNLKERLSLWSCPR